MFLICDCFHCRETQFDVCDTNMSSPAPVPVGGSAVASPNRPGPRPVRAAQRQGGLITRARNHSTVVCESAREKNKTKFCAASISLKRACSCSLSLHAAGGAGVHGHMRPAAQESGEDHGHPDGERRPQHWRQCGAALSSR